MKYLSIILPVSNADFLAELFDDMMSSLTNDFGMDALHAADVHLADSMLDVPNAKLKAFFEEAIIGQAASLDAKASKFILAYIQGNVYKTPLAGMKDLLNNLNLAKVVYTPSYQLVTTAFFGHLDWKDPKVKVDPIWLAYGMLEAEMDVVLVEKYGNELYEQCMDDGDPSVSVPAREASYYLGYFTQKVINTLGVTD